MTDLLGLEQTDLIGQSLYQFVHANDIQHLEQSHRLLLDKGQVITKYYRLMRRDGGFVWVQSYSNVLSNPRNTPKPQHIVSICMILGDDPYDQSRFLYDRCETPTKADHEISTSLSFDSCVSQAPRCHGERRTQTVKQSSLSAAKMNEKCTKRDKLGQMRKMKQPRPAIKCQLAKANAMMIAQSQPSKTTETKRALLDRVQTVLVEPDDDRQHLATLESSSYSRHLIHTSSAHNNLVTSSTLEAPPASEYCASIRNYGPGFATIGSTRRASDDSCSIVSSVASTSISSLSSSTHHGAAATPEHYLPATFGVTSDNCSLDSHHLPHQHSFNTSSMSRSSVQNSVELAGGGGVGGESCLVSIDGSCRASKSQRDHCAPMSQQIVGPDNSLVWPGVEELGTYQLDNQERHFGPTTMNQFVHVNTASNQPWINTTTQAHMCSSAPDRPLNLNSEFNSDHQIQHHSNLHHHQTNAGDIYMETHQPYDCYTTGHSAAIHFHPSANIYTV